MYPFERHLRKLKKNVQNKAKVEGSICNAYLVEEASTFCVHYFEDHVYTRHQRVPRNDDGGLPTNSQLEGNLPIFNYPGHPIGQPKKHFLIEVEQRVAQSYILLNCAEVGQYLNIYIDELRQTIPVITDSDIDVRLEEHFASWFQSYVRESVNTNQFIVALAKGTLPIVNVYSGYFVNGYKFHIEGFGSTKKTINNGVCIKGSNYSDITSDFYGRLIEVLELEYPALPIK